MRKCLNVLMVFVLTIGLSIDYATAGWLMRGCCTPAPCCEPAPVECCEVVQSTCCGDVVESEPAAAGCGCSASVVAEEGVVTESHAPAEPTPAEPTPASTFKPEQDWSSAEIETSPADVEEPSPAEPEPTPTPIEVAPDLEPITPPPVMEEEAIPPLPEIADEPEATPEDDLFGAPDEPMIEEAPADDLFGEPMAEEEMPAEEAADDLFGDEPAMEEEVPSEDLFGEPAAEEAMPAEESVDDLFGDEPAMEEEAPAEEESLDDFFSAPAEEEAPAEEPMTEEAPSEDLFGEPAAEETMPAEESVDDLFGEEPAIEDEPAMEDEPAEEEAPAEEQPADEGSDEFEDLFNDDNLLGKAEPILRQPGGLNSAEMRTWVDNTGLYRTRGRLLSVADGSVKLLKSNGHTSTVPFARLSGMDLSFVNLQASAQQSLAVMRTAQR